jgi:LPXTG-site transpeptidase (sortase) family protein
LWLPRVARLLIIRSICIEMPMPAPNIWLPRTLIRSAKKTDQDALALLQALLDTPIAASSERRGPVSLRAVEPQRRSRPHRPADPTWFDALLHRSSQALLVGSALVLGYWAVNVPINSWLHQRGAPVVRASAGQPRANALRVSFTPFAPTRAAIQAGNAGANPAQSASQSERATPQPRASAIPAATSTIPPTAMPPATATATAGASALAADVLPTAAPTQTATPPVPSPTAVLLWPTITPVQLATVSKPSPAPVQRPVAVAQPAAPGSSRAASALPSRLIIPALGLDTPIKEVFIVNNEWQVAQYAAGYLNGSGRPGAPGNLALSGHAGLYGAVFAHLGSLEPGDDIYVDAAGVRYRYRLRTASAVWPNQADLLDSTEAPTMTLITCTNWDTQRLVAQADFVASGPALDG